MTTTTTIRDYVRSVLLSDTSVEPLTLPANNLRGVMTILNTDTSNYTIIINDQQDPNTWLAVPFGCDTDYLNTIRNELLDSQLELLINPQEPTDFGVVLRNKEPDSVSEWHEQSTTDQGYAVWVFIGARLEEK